MQPPEMNLAGVRRVLDSNPWFRAIPPAVKDAIFRRASVRSVKKGCVLTLQGTVNEAMYGIVEGAVHILRHRPDGDEALIHEAGPGYWVGEASVIRRAPAVVTCIAQTDSRLIALAREAFEEVVGEHPALWRHLAILEADRLAQLLAYLADTRDLTLQARLCSRLAELAQERARDAGEPTDRPVTLPFSQASLARIVGVSRQTLNALLADLGHAGFISVGFRRVTVNDVGRLREHAARAGERQAGTSRRAGLALRRH